MALESAPAPWTDALKVLPARERLAWQRMITADVAAQGAMPKQGPRSRAYDSGGPPMSAGLAAIRPGELGLVAGSALAAPSTADFLASVITAAFEKAKVPLPDALELPMDSTASASNPLAAAIRAASLDVGYRLVVAKALQRRLATDAEWTAERGVGAAAASADASACPATRFASLASIADGALVSAAAAAAAAPVVRGSDASAGASGAAAGAAASQQREDALLDAAMAELLAP